MYYSQEVARRLLVARCYPSVLLDPVDEPLHLVPLLVQDAIILPLLLAILQRRDTRCPALLLDLGHQLFLVESLVRDHRLGFLALDQGGSVGDVRFLTTRYDALHGVAESIDGDVDFGAEAAARTPQRLALAPPF